MPYTYLSPGIDNCVTVAFPGFLSDIPAGSYEFLVYCAPYYVPSSPVEGVTYYFDNLRIVMHGVEYPATYQSPANYVLQGTFDCNGIAPHYTILVDLHRISNHGGTGAINFYGSSKTFGDIKGFWYSTVPSVSESGTIDRDPLSSTKYNYRVSIPQYIISSSSALNLSDVETFYNDLSAVTLDYAMYDAGGTMYLNKQSLTITAITRVTQQVTDSAQQQLTQQQTEQQHKDAEAQLTESQKQTSIQEEHKNTTKGIFSKISEFFAGFFDGITNSLLSLFVPDDDYFSDFFARLNTFFEEKLGMLYTPIGLFVDLLSALGDASGEFAGIQFPGIKWEDTYLIEPQLVNFTVIPGLQEKIYFITDVIMVGGILWLLQIKMKEVLSG